MITEPVTNCVNPLNAAFAKFSFSDLSQIGSTFDLEAKSRNYLINKLVHRQKNNQQIF